VIATIKQRLKKTIIFDLFVWFRRCSANLDEIRAQSRSNVYHHSPVHDMIKKLAIDNSIKVFFETGTYLGNTVCGVKDVFEEVYSVELSRELAQLARERFAKDKHVHIINEDSSTALNTFVMRLKQPAIFWLDAHYSAGVTAKGKVQTPVKEELRAILSHPLKSHYILIDDVKDFNGHNDYPTVAEILEMVEEFGIDAYEARVQGDVFLVRPSLSQATCQPE
jgi:hypothetical protein